ncbi:MAG: hypothetical protein PWR22_891 [Moorella sp. (in: firmicutes)]|jgi:hypothetical protein|uniref:Uncharacterized protein n=1 Tax=Neomoorella humiferrea TaxID=676965 RepID=A0A2T0AR07_9FIRM|nr:hypothetical protein [Moorella humiferrea]MDK2816262.1 hypothetical protein [Moorella sp. (in: firmicutes)]PRR71941.1 hypothetical protein MOHU_15730 [Moorella humiferrea]
MFFKSLKRFLAKVPLWKEAVKEDDEFMFSLFMLAVVIGFTWIIFQAIR